MTINEKASYIKGLYDASDFDSNSKEVKIIGEMIDLISKMSSKITSLEADNAELREYIEELDSDLGVVEEDLYLTDENDDEYEDSFDSFDDEDSEYYELECPNCGEIVCFDDSLDTDSLVCPACGEKVGDVELCDGNCDSCDNQDCE